MGKTIDLYNPFGLTEFDIEEYLKIVRDLAIAKYRLYEDLTSENFLEAYSAQRKRTDFESYYEDKTETLIFEEIMPKELIESFGYFFWEGKFEDSEYKGKNFLIGKVVMVWNHENLPVKHVAIQKDNFQGVNLYENMYSQNIGGICSESESITIHNHYFTKLKGNSGM